MQLTVANNMEMLQQALVPYVKQGRRTALVPTMGALHEGHAALVRHATTLAETVVVSIFVNPRQFGPNEDLARYPRTLDNDLQVAQSAGAAIVYAPDVDDLYPEGYATTVSAGAMGNELCGKFRPGHFDGVATVVTKLLMRTLPNVAVFGEKDFQQLCIIERVVDDLDIPVEIIGFPTIREADGLALSSRNSYLNAQERAIAPKLYETLQWASAELAGGGRSVHDIIGEAMGKLTSYGFKPDYLELRASDTLAPVSSLNVPSRLLVAAWLGKTRLIDNIAVG